MAPAPPAASSAGGCIDLSHPDEDEVARRIADACGTWGFFQVTGHGIPPGLVGEFRAASAAFFALPGPAKDALRRDGANARGYFDDELTKQRRDWKEALDVGAPGGGDWSLPDGHPSNACLDGYNRFPPEEVLPGYRDTVVRYFGACEGLADRIAVLMARGLGADAGAGAGAGADGGGGPLLARMRSRHTSYLRTNYYPPYVPGETAPADPASPPPLGISPHKDAGFLTVLVQDDDCHSLQVARFEGGDESREPEWTTVVPVPGAMTINTGDMAMIWSNGRYRAPLHRVLTAERERISAPFFYNPGFDAMIEPLPTLTEKEAPLYHPCCWGYFRAVRFAGDFTDIGIEIQISHFEKGGKESGSSDRKEEEEEEEEEEKEEKEPFHVKTQEAFLRSVDFCAPFSIEAYRPLLEGGP